MLRFAKSLLKWVLRGVLAFVAFLLLYLGAAFLLGHLTANSDRESPTSGTEIYLITNGVHLDVCLPVDAMDPGLADQLMPENTTGGYLSFGWGDKGFYLDTPTWADLKASTALKSLFWPTPTAMHVTWYPSTPTPGEKVRIALITPEERQAINHFLRNGFDLDEAGRVQAINCCDYPGVTDAFYEGRGVYHLFRTCNTWTNQCLKESGLKTAVWTPFDSGTLNHFPQD